MTASIDDRADEKGDGRHGGHDFARVALPAHDREAHPKLVKVQDGNQGDICDRVGAECLRAQQPGEHDAYTEQADLIQQRAAEAPAQRAGRLAR
jgi:hypothetical protein